jgi:hypothetical protein
VADPVITAVVASPDPLPAGGQGTLRIVGSDPDDAGSFSGEGIGRDEAGNEARFTFNVAVDDKVTWSMTVDRGSVTQDSEDPQLFHWQDA